MEVALQLKKGILYPHSIEDQEKIKDLKENQIVKAKITGVRKPRSYKQLKLYWTCCRKVAENTFDDNWNTKLKVDLQCRMRTKFFDDKLTIVAGNKVIFTPRSISFKNLKHIESCRYFDQAFEIMAKYMGVEVEVLVGEGNSS